MRSRNVKKIVNLNLKNSLHTTHSYEKKDFLNLNFATSFLISEWRILTKTQITTEYIIVREEFVQY